MNIFERVMTAGLLKDIIDTNTLKIRLIKDIRVKRMSFMNL